MLKAFSNLSARVLLLIAVPFVVLLGTSIHHMFDMREDGIMNARTRVLEIARRFAAKQDRTIERIHGILSSTALLPQVGRAVASPACDRSLAAELQKEPNLNTIVLALANGDVVCNAVSSSQRTNLSDRDHFKAAILTHEFSVGGYVVDQDTGRPGIGVALPLLDEAGVPRAVIATTLNLAWLELEMAKTQLPAGSRVVIMDRDGLVLARHPDPEQELGKRISELPLLRRIVAKGDEGTEEGISQDGVRQIYGFAPLHRTVTVQEYLWISIPKDAVIGPVDRAFVESLLVAVTLLMLFFWAMWLGFERFFIRRIAVLAGASKELGEGSLANRIKLKVNDGIAISSRDVAESKESAARLRKSEERLRLAMTTAHMGVWTWDPHSDKLSLLEGVEPIFGLPPGEGSSTPGDLIKAIHPADRDLLARALSEGRQRNTPIRLEFRTTRLDGTVRWVEVRNSIIHDATGVPEHVEGIVMDITERKRAAEALVAGEKKFRDLVENSSDWIWEVDEKGTYTYCSPKVRDLLGYAPQELIGKSPFDLMPPSEGARVAALFGARIAEKEALVALENINLHKDGREVVLETSGVPFFDSHGTYKGYRGIDRNITGRRRGERALARANRALRTLSACNETLIHAVSEPELLNSVCRLAVDAGAYCMAWVRFAEHDAAKTLRVVAQYGSDEGYLESTSITWADTEQGRGPTGTAIRTGETQVNQNMLTNPNMAPWRDAALARGFQSSIAMPLKGPAGTLGALTLYARESDAFDKDEVQLLEKLADDLAFGITTLRTRLERDRMAYAHQHHEEILRKSLEESVQAIADTLEMRDPYTAGHQKSVATLAVAIARSLGLPEDEAHGVHLAASIHDLGKIQVPAEILSKPSKLSDIEFMLIKTHAQAGYEILKGIEFPWPIAAMVLQHHERLDGSGYPQGLKDDQILLGSRIIAVADVVEAMASHRPYRPSLGIDAALQEIEKGRGTVYDPAVADACLKLFREEQFALT